MLFLFFRICTSRLYIKVCVGLGMESCCILKDLYR